MFADDTVLLAESEEDLKWNAEKMHEAMKRRRQLEQVKPNGLQ